MADYIRELRGSKIPKINIFRLFKKFYNSWRIALSVFFFIYIF